MVSTAQAEGVLLSFPPCMQTIRDGLRREMRARRRALRPHERAALSRELCKRIAGSALFLRARRIAFYLPNDGEADLRPLIERAWTMGKHCYLPVLAPGSHNRLGFAPYRHDTPLLANRFGIPEPRIRWSEVDRAWGMDLVLTPLVAFDAQGNRLGMGGGFYDRTLAYLDARSRLRKPRLLGVAFELQKVESLPTENWDVPLEGVVTETGCYGRW